MNKKRKIFLAIVSVLVLAPALFIGTCLPIGALSFGYSGGGSTFGMVMAFILGFIVAGLGVGFSLYSISGVSNSANSNKMPIVRKFSLFILSILVWILIPFMFALLTGGIVMWIYILFFIILGIFEIWFIIWLAKK